MTLRNVLKFEFTCDGYKPTGSPCPCDLFVEACSQHGAEEQARRIGWYKDHRGWICNADGHRGDGVTIPPLGPYTDEQKAAIAEMFGRTVFCAHCNQRVPKYELEEGQHIHPAVMD